MTPRQGRELRPWQPLSFTLHPETTPRGTDRAPAAAPMGTAFCHPAGPSPEPKPHKVGDRPEPALQQLESLRPQDTRGARPSGSGRCLQEFSHNSQRRIRP